VGHDNLDVADCPRQPDQPMAERLPGNNNSARLRIDRQYPLNARRPICGAMSEQSGDTGRGNDSAPQKFVRLVGCGDSKAGLEQPGTGPRVVRLRTR
jgi:hypothetical protein